MTKLGLADDRGTLPKARATGCEEVRTGLYVLVVLTAGAYLPSPLYPGYQEAFGSSDLVMTLIYATFALVSAPALLLFGSASDAVGPRSVLRISLLLAAAGSAGFAFASGSAWLLAARAAQGLALGAVTGAASALISTGAGDRSSSRGSSAGVLTSTAFVAGTAAGPIAAGVLAEYAPAPHLLPFLLHLALLWTAWLRVSALPAVRRKRRWKPTRPHVPAGMRLLFTTAALTGFLAWAVAGLFLSVIPTLLGRSDQTNLAVTGGVLGAVLICSVLTQPLVPRLGVRRAQLLGLAALLAGLLVLALTAAESTALTLCAAVVAGAGHGLAFGGAAAVVDEVSPQEQRGAITGALYLAFYLGSGVPAVAIGLITLGTSLAVATTWVTGVAAVLVPLAGAAVVLTRHRRRAALAA
ncbi:MFS transporter [Salinifilum aidingensis]